MTVELAHLKLAIDSQSMLAEMHRLRPSTWPPSNDFPIVIDVGGNIISRYGDSVWDLSLWANKPVILNFCDGRHRKSDPDITPANADLLRQVVAWWMYGPKSVRSPITLRQRFFNIRPLFILCSRYKIVASNIQKFPLVVDEYSNLSGSEADRIFSQLYALYEQREQLGFTLLDREGLRRLEANLPDHESRQTPYIPPRIWSYQVSRLREFLEDFHKYRVNIEDCYNFCIEAYAKNSGSLAEACRVGRKRTSGPFWTHNQYTGARTGFIYHGPFYQVAQRFGIDELLSRWVINQNSSIERAATTIRSLSTYFSMVGYVGLAYLLNFSLMRVDEAWSLRADCLDVESDANFGQIYILRGRTSKTINDDDARWPTSPSVKIAVEAMACIARLRMICAEANPDVPSTAEEISNPYLIVRAYEPWGTCGAKEFRKPLSIRPQPKTYLQIFDDAYPKLFNSEELRITQADLDAARLVTPTLNSEIFAIGKVWPLAWHQLRRTGAVNMQTSGLVSDASLQYLLKHASRAMSLYYGQGYSRVRLDEKAQAMYIRTMYEVLGKEIANLFTDRFISPHGDRRKAEILKIVAPNDSQKLAEFAALGKVSWRETLLGGCTKRGSCPYGGVDNVAHCGGGDGGPPCADVLYDREKAQELYRLKQVVSSRLLEAPDGSPYWKSLEAQLKAVENALNVIESK